MTSTPTNRNRVRERGGAGGAFLLLLVLGGIGAGWWWLQRAEPPPPINPARTVAVQRRDLMRAVLATGRVEPLARVAVMSRASGILKQIHVEEGDRVKKGQVLAELDREQLEAQNQEDLGNLAAAEARLKAAIARLEEAKVKLTDPELEFARTQAQRLQDLFAAGTATKTELDDALLRHANVKYRLEQTRASLPVLEAGVAQAEADLLSARAAVDRSATALREATILSPIDGLVLLREREEGDGVSSILTAGGNATEIMTLGDLSQMFVEASVDEVDVGRVEDRMRAVIEVDAYRGRPFEGRVVRIAPAGTVDNNGIVTFLVRIAVDDPQGILRVDMTANVRLVLEDRPDTLALPHKALRRGKDGEWLADRVVRQDPPQVETVDIRIGVSDGLMTEILDGLGEGDRVLVPSDTPAAAFG